MTGKPMGFEVADLIAGLPEVPQPWSIDKLCKRLTLQRGRELQLHSLHIPALPFGLWYDDGKRDHIIYRVGVSGYHRDHIILHEVCHMLARHRAADRFALSREGGSREDLLARLINHTIINPHTDRQEELAETFASKVLKLSKQTTLASLSDFEERAAAMFGAC